MNCWLFITSPENWQITREQNLLGYPERYKNTLSRVCRGDRCVIYIKTAHQISGEFVVASDVFYGDDRIFHSPPKAPKEVFPLRLKLRNLMLSSDPIDFKPLVPKLSSIKNKRNWGATLHGNALLKLPEEDFRIITSSFNVPSQNNA